MTEHALPRHWSREPWPWILMALPASAVVAGFITLWLALQSDNSMVVDDYYKQGKAINQRIARDARASELGLSAQVSLRDGRLSVSLGGDLGQPLAALAVRFVHVAHAQRDWGGLAHLGPDGKLVLHEVLTLTPGRYRLHLEPAPSGDWRLVSEVVDIGEDGAAQFAVRAAEIARYRVGAAQ